MGINHIAPGEHFAAAYQVSATPWLTSSVLSAGETREINFTHATRFVFVKNTAAASTTLAVGVTELGMTKGNYLMLSGSEHYAADLRTHRLFLSASNGTPTFSVAAGLTYIPVNNVTIITGSNGFSGVG